MPQDMLERILLNTDLKDRQELKQIPPSTITVGRPQPAVKWSPPRASPDHSRLSAQLQGALLLRQQAVLCGWRRQQLAVPLAFPATATNFVAYEAGIARQAAAAAALPLPATPHAGLRVLLGGQQRPLLTRAPLPQLPICALQAAAAPRRLGRARLLPGRHPPPAHPPAGGLRRRALRHAPCVGQGDAKCARRSVHPGPS